MSQYNWSNLSDHDFENVCRDVMAADLGGPIEAFAAGQDGGIDLRFTGDGGLVIGQAKHYLSSSYSQLLSAVKREKKKLDKMSPPPVRYILYTSKGLSPQRKSELKDAMHPYVVADNDVVGVDDLEGHLVRHPEIEKHHYKLWLSSIKVLERIFGNATQTRTDVRVEELVSKSRLYVPHAKLVEAEQILASEHCLIISGPAGIGKTTMAEMLTLKFLGAEPGPENDKGEEVKDSSPFDVYFVTSIQELEEKFRSDGKQVFVFDDFLGRANFREAPDTPSQERLFSMMKHVAKKPNKFFILTTREYLYREVRANNDRLSASRSDLMRCFLDVKGYDSESRAQILYNHLYWSDGVPEDSLRHFVSQGDYWEIIRHANFNPRWIADCLARLAQPRSDSAGLPWT